MNSGTWAVTVATKKGQREKVISSTITFQVKVTTYFIQATEVLGLITHANSRQQRANLLQLENIQLFLASCSLGTALSQKGEPRECLDCLGQTYLYYGKDVWWTTFIITMYNVTCIQLIHPVKLWPQPTSTDRWFPKNSLCLEPISEQNGNKLTGGSVFLIIFQGWKHVLPQVFHERQLHVH